MCSRASLRLQPNELNQNNILKSRSFGAGSWRLRNMAFSKRDGLLPRRSTLDVCGGSSTEDAGLPGKFPRCRPTP